MQRQASCSFVLLSVEIFCAWENFSVAAEGTSTPLCATPAHNGDPGGCAPYSFCLVAALPCYVLCGSSYVCNTPTLNSATSGFRLAASSAVISACRVSTGSMILSIHSLAAP